jgi:hypothetical protein
VRAIPEMYCGDHFLWFSGDRERISSMYFEEIAASLIDRKPIIFLVNAADTAVFKISRSALKPPRAKIIVLRSWPRKISSA